MTKELFIDSSLEKYIKRLSLFIGERFGLDFTGSKRRDLYHLIQREAERTKEDDLQKYIASLFHPPYSQIQEIAQKLTVSETYFFREMNSLKAFQDTILTQFISSKGSSFKIWSAGCSSGEEAYTISIILREKLPPWALPNIFIYGTDINQESLQKAKEGIYREWSFRSTPPSLKKRYFQLQKDGRYGIQESLKERVSFSYLNLVEDGFPSMNSWIYDLDVIFCRNVMIYFQKESHQRLIEKLYGSLKKGGWLIVAPSETSVLLSSKFTPVSISGATLYQKKEEENNRKSMPVTISLEEIDKPPSLRKVTPSLLLEDDDPSQLFLKAQHHFQKKEYEKALDQLHIFFSKEDRDNERIEALSLQARILANKGQLKEALASCLAAIDTNRGDPRLYYLQGIIHQEENHLPEAIEALKKSLYLDPNFIAAHYMLANLSLLEGDGKKTSQYLKNTKALLSNLQKDETLPDLGGITVGRLFETIQGMMKEKERHDD